jgi:ppGpp synthetase/RelA/SpoT-type nucleotidyltranferase
MEAIAAIEAATKRWLDACAYEEEFDGLSQASKSQPTPAWGSKKLVNRAGDAVRTGRQLSPEEVQALDAWRRAHKYVLNTFQAILRNRTKGTQIVVAQRLKRRSTIVDKLFRESKMQLARMDDLAGCRMIFPDIKTLRAFRADLLKARFNHRVRNDVSKYDYIANPKRSGYRGIHDIYEYNPQSKKGAPFKGLLLEVQYRTLAQHAWATAVEVVSRITENQPKFDRGDERHKEFFRLTSEIIARTVEGTTSVYGEISNEELLKRFEAIDAEINLVRMLRGLHTIYEGGPDGGNIILQFSENGQLTIHKVEDDEKATEEYFRLEKSAPKDDIVLVNADTFEDVRSAYRNYFSDPQDFLRYVNEGCMKLGGRGFL